MRLPLLFSLLLLCLCSQAQEWQLKWSDEFNYTGHPDPKKWGYESGYVRNNEKQYYTTKRLENARVENGHLIIEGRKESPDMATLPNEPTKRRIGINYTSASLHTKGIASWEFGYIEVRAKVPKGKGVWPAIWTLGDNIDQVNWPRCGEIDILEFVGKDPKKIHANAHFLQNGKHTSNQKGQPVSEPWKEFHHYGMQWDRDWIHFYFDGQRYHSFKVSKADGTSGNPFHRPHYLILNLALGGTWGGTIDGSIFPAQYLIDFVRVYQVKP